MGSPFFFLGKRETKLKAGDKIHIIFKNNKKEEATPCSFSFMRGKKKIAVVENNNNGDRCPFLLNFNLTWCEAKNIAILLAASHGLTVIKEELISSKERIFTLEKKPRKKED